MRDTERVIRRILPIAIGATALLLGAAAASARTAIDVVGNDAPAWSPDGTQIAFTSFRNGNDLAFLGFTVDSEDLASGHVADTSWLPKIPK